MFIGTTQSTTEIEDGIVVIQRKIAEEFFQFLEAIANLWRITFAGFCVGLHGYTPYDCRHTFTTQAIRVGMDKQTLRRILGHADLATTDKYYTHLGLDDILKATEGLDLKITVSNKSVTSQKTEKLTVAKSS